MGLDRNYRGIDGNCREINLIRGSHPPYRKREIKREKERERYALMHLEIVLFFNDRNMITSRYL